ncbi:hypothetical protein [Desulfoluna spongiiphila]|uniref:hypothetical protein n=1 Tax=Desulfoluna spongiiphila TaxID=419481 RepID=UPI000B86EFBE|nr:hypothetical protein [Desulfoluna spongiiphila]
MGTAFFVLVGKVPDPGNQSGPGGLRNSETGNRGQETGDRLFMLGTPWGLFLAAEQLQQAFKKPAAWFVPQAFLCTLPR